MELFSAVSRQISGNVFCVRIELAPTSAARSIRTPFVPFHADCSLCLLANLLHPKKRTEYAREEFFTTATPCIEHRLCVCVCVCRGAPIKCSFRARTSINHINTIKLLYLCTTPCSFAPNRKPASAKRPTHTRPSPLTHNHNPGMRDERDGASLQHSINSQSAPTIRITARLLPHPARAYIWSVRAVFYVSVSLRSVCGTYILGGMQNPYNNIIYSWTRHYTST